ncbi:hypothetical protein [Frigoribacterium faeni]|uniref:Uncharacterized protein n=1 Tax=Frigoribacterium faeni TaxID=145483 RepID=A0A7W3JH48_9MICO|nr:hypothetical protein [Frigoribacterium faeni]MBA8812688.1 hypothetical protein [Frigoribacterium faeni]GEK82297.1 hypothetical protein FFA01_06060 [Frigoribacterium faeni]
MNHMETEALLIQVAAIDSRTVSDLTVAAWQAVLADMSYADAEQAHIAHRRNNPGIYLEPGHLIQQKCIARQRHQEIHGVHPAPPAGKRWAVDVIESVPDTDLPELRA